MRAIPVNDTAPGFNTNVYGAVPVPVGTVIVAVPDTDYSATGRCNSAGSIQAGGFINSNCVKIDNLDGTIVTCGISCFNYICC